MKQDEYIAALHADLEQQLLKYRAVRDEEAVLRGRQRGIEVSIAALRCLLKDKFGVDSETLAKVQP